MKVVYYFYLHTNFRNNGDIFTLCISYVIISETKLTNEMFI